jgi:hypothetical protein
MAPDPSDPQRHATGTLHIGRLRLMTTTYGRRTSVTVNAAGADNDVRPGHRSLTITTRSCLIGMPGLVVALMAVERGCLVVLRLAYLAVTNTLAMLRPLEAGQLERGARRRGTGVSGSLTAVHCQIDGASPSLPMMRTGQANPA